MARIIYLETCLSDYFNGFGGHTLAIPVDALTTKKALREAIIQEANSVIDDETIFPDDASLEKSVSEVMMAFISEHPFPEVGADLEMPKGYFAVENDDYTWSLYKGDEDAMENADLVEENLPSRAGALIEAHNAECSLDIHVYCYFGIKQDD